MSRNNIEYRKQGSRVYPDDPITSRGHHADYHIRSSHHPTLARLDEQFMLILFDTRQHRNNAIDVMLTAVGCIGCVKISWYVCISPVMAGSIHDKASQRRVTGRARHHPE